MKLYKGDPRTREVTVEYIGDEQGKAAPYPLPMRLDAWNHSPTGFAWGYGGSGPAQLALALALDVLGDDSGARELALQLYQGLKWRLVAKLQGLKPFTLSELQVAEELLGVLREQVPPLLQAGDDGVERLERLVAALSAMPPWPELRG